MSRPEEPLWHGDGAGLPPQTRRELDRAAVLIGWATYLDSLRDAPGAFPRPPAHVVLSLAETAADVLQTAIFEWRETQVETLPAPARQDASPDDVVASLRRAREAGRGDDGPPA